MYRSRLRCGAIGVALLVIVGLVACVPPPVQTSAGATPAFTVALPEESAMPTAAPSSAGRKPPSGILSVELESLLAAYQAGDQPTMTMLLEQYGTGDEPQNVRVILELGEDAEVVSGEPIIEVITLEDGSEMEIEHAPEVSVRSDLADAIVQAGARIETAHGNLIQVITPIQGLTPLAEIPGVVRMRLPYPAEAQ